MCICNMYSSIWKCVNHNEIRLIFLFRCLFFTQTEIDRYISIDRLIEIRIDNKDNRIRQSNQTSCWFLWDKLFELDYLGQKKVSNHKLCKYFSIGLFPKLENFL